MPPSTFTSPYSNQSYDVPPQPKPLEPPKPAEERGLWSYVVSICLTLAFVGVLWGALGSPGLALALCVAINWPTTVADQSTVVIDALTNRIIALEGQKISLEAQKIALETRNKAHDAATNMQQSAIKEGAVNKLRELGWMTYFDANSGQVIIERSRPTE